LSKLSGFRQADDIAEFLRGEGIRGIRHDPWAGPISEWILRDTGETLKSIGVDGAICQATPCPTCGRGNQHYYYKFPQPLKDFIDKFNLGGYPELEHG
jgi:hypothetical protein